MIMQNTLFATRTKLVYPVFVVGVAVRAVHIYLLR